MEDEEEEGALAELAGAEERACDLESWGAGDPCGAGRRNTPRTNNPVNIDTGSQTAFRHNRPLMREKELVWVEIVFI